MDALLASFGLQDHAHTLIGTPVRKGLSGGQIRRVGIASQLITCPKILFLDEPTSGLDSVASHEVMFYLKEVARKNNVGCCINIRLSTPKGPDGLTSLPDSRHREHPSTVDVDV